MHRQLVAWLDLLDQAWGLWRHRERGVVSRWHGSTQCEAMLSTAHGRPRRIRTGPEVYGFGLVFPPDCRRSCPWL